MDLLNNLLTVVLFLNSLFLILLVLVQLPKKEAGLGTAFGGGATDALFGAGAGNVLTKLTKWNAVIFLFLCLLLSLDFMRPKELSEMLGQNAPTVKSNASAPPPAESPLSPEANLPATTPSSPNPNGTQKKSGKPNPEKKKND
jgi:preprotein translocase subunit SecG